MDLTIREAIDSDLPRLVALLRQESLDTPREHPGPPLPGAYHEAFLRIEADPSHEAKDLTRRLRGWLRHGD